MKKNEIKKNYEALLKFYHSDRDICDLISNNLQRCRRYVESVNEMETQLPLIRLQYTGQQVRDWTEELSFRVSISYQAAQAAISQLVRWATMVGVEPMFSGNQEDDIEVSRFCLDIVDTFFEGYLERKKEEV